MSNFWIFFHILIFYSLNGVFLLLVSCVSISEVQNKHLSQSSILSLSEETDTLDTQSIENYLRNFSKQHKDLSSQWWVKYQRAKLWEIKNREKACLALKELTETTDFPLHKVALVRKKTVCRIEEKDLIELKQILENKNDKWLHHLTAQVGTDQARYLSLPSYLSYFQYKLSFYTPISSKQIELLEQSIASAKKAKDYKQEQLSSDRLYQIAPRLMPDTPNKKVSVFKLAYDYRKAREFHKAISIYQSIVKNLKSPFHEVYKALRHLRSTSKLMNNKEDVLKYSAQLAEVTRNAFLESLNTRRNKQICHKEKTRLYHDGVLIYAKTLWTQGNRTQAQKILQVAQENLKECKTSGHIYWVLTQMREEAKDFQQAIVWAQRGVEVAKLRSTIWEKLKWRLAWNFRKTSQFQKAAVHFKEIIAVTKDSFLRSQYSYWLARTFEDMGHYFQAQMEFQKLTQTNALGYYGLLAYRSLKKPIPAFNNQNMGLPKRFIASRRSSVVNENLIKWLIAVNEKELAKNYLRTQKAKISHKKDMEGLIDYFSIVGDHIQVFSYLSRSSFDVISFPHLLFPTPYLRQITELSHKYAVPKELIYSIIRQESAFNRYARSPADAFGLMQLLPRVAKKTAQLSDVPYHSVEDLYNPKTNLSLGILHLRELLDKFDNQFVMAVASYNAPEEAVRNWVKDRFHDKPIEFIEDIPYRETRLYVKLVIRNLIFYQRLFSDKEISFPEWCLDGLQSFKS